MPSFEASLNRTSDSECGSRLKPPPEMVGKVANGGGGEWSVGRLDGAFARKTSAVTVAETSGKRLSTYRTNPKLLHLPYANRACCNMAQGVVVNFSAEVRNEGRLTIA